MSIKTYTLKLTGAIAIDGQIITAGNTIEADEALAKNLLHRGKAELIEAPEANEAVETADTDSVDLTKLTKAQLLIEATNLGIADVSDSNTKAEIIAAIEAAEVAQ